MSFLQTLTTFATPQQQTSKYVKVLHRPSGFNEAVQSMQYAVRGQLVLRAQELSRQLEAGSKLPFSSVIYCNIGNPQSVGQPPITFIRQCVAAVTCPSLLDTSALPSDVVSRAREFLRDSHGVGAYSESKGVYSIRKRIAEAIARRDGYPSNPDTVYLSNGASEAVKALLQITIRNSQDGVMTPIPQYPLYSASLTALSGRQVGYYLDEQNDWSLNIDELQRSLHKARKEGTQVRSIVVINPGNPTGQVLSRENMEDIVRFCERENLVLMADEVYQKNIYTKEKPFISFKKVVRDLNSPVELASFHSISKGVMGECGLRGGYVELVNTERDVEELLYKVMSVSLCSNLIGQFAIDLMMTPPKEGEPSYELYKRETDGIFNDLKNKAVMLCDALNTLEGVSCNKSEGAMYLFPRITLPEKTTVEAKKRGYACADVLYCMELLNATGICVVPGSGFGQKEGTLHFRTTFLPPKEAIDDVMKRLRKFHERFLLSYS